MLTPSKTSSPHNVINTRDPMPNPGQIQIFYKAGQTRLTQAKCNPVDPDDPDDLTRLQRWSVPPVMCLFTILHTEETTTMQISVYFDSLFHH